MHYGDPCVVGREEVLVVEPLHLGLGDGHEAALQLGRRPHLRALRLRPLRERRRNPLHDVRQRGFPREAPPVCGITFISYFELSMMMR